MFVTFKFHIGVCVLFLFVPTTILRIRDVIFSLLLYQKIKNTFTTKMDVVFFGGGAKNCYPHFIRICQKSGNYLTETKFSRLIHYWMSILLNTVFHYETLGKYFGGYVSHTFSISRVYFSIGVGRPIILQIYKKKPLKILYQ